MKIISIKNTPLRWSVGDVTCTAKMYYPFGHMIFVSPAKQKRDICIAFPAPAASAA